MLGLCSCAERNLNHDLNRLKVKNQHDQANKFQAVPRLCLCPLRSQRAETFRREPQSSPLEGHNREFHASPRQDRSSSSQLDHTKVCTAGCVESEFHLLKVQSGLEANRLQ